MTTPVGTETGNIWPTIAANLKLRVDRATWDTWLKDLECLAIDKDHIAISCPDPMTADWCENRLQPVILAAITSTTGTTPALAFIYPSTPQKTHIDDLPIHLQLIHHDPRDTGFVMISNYAIQFWQPLLSQDAWCLWVTLRSYAWDAQRWAWPSIRTLAEIVTNGNRHRITGRAERNDRARQIGAIESLEAEGLLRVSRDADTYLFRVIDKLPLLSPARIKLLPAHLRRAHKRYLQRAALANATELSTCGDTPMAPP